MTTEAKFAAVLAAVRERALKEEQSIEFSMDFIGGVSDDLRLDFRQDGYRRRTWDKFCGQVGRALNKLAGDGTLVRSGKGRGNIRYWAPAAWEEHQQREADRKESERAAYQRAREIAARFAALGVTTTAVFPSGRFEVTAIRLDELTVLEELLDLAEKGARS